MQLIIVSTFAIARAGDMAPVVALLGGDTDRIMDVAVALAEIVSGMWLEEQAQLKTARIRRNWAKARAFVRVYPYAIFWGDHSCLQLCAPGGRWAERDRAAFEADFGK